MVWDAFDDDGSGNINYEEFLDELGDTPHAPDGTEAKKAATGDLG